MLADVLSEEGKHHMGCLTVRADNQPHPQGPGRKSSTNDTVLCFPTHLSLWSPATHAGHIVRLLF